MDAKTQRYIDLAMAYSGPLFVVGYIIFWGIMGHNIPPPNMLAMSGEEFVANYYAKYPELPVAMIVSAVVAAFYLPWSCLLSSLLKDSNGNMSALGLLELTAGAVTALLLAACPVIWAACAIMYPVTDPETIKLIHMFCWFLYDCTYMLVSLQLFGAGLYAALNKEQNIFPAWAGWCAVVGGCSMIPLSLIAFVSEGAFAINGLWNFYIAYSGWLFLFFSLYCYFVLKHVHGGKSSVAQNKNALPA